MSFAASYEYYVDKRATIVQKDFNAGDGIRFSTPVGARVDNRKGEWLSGLVGRVGVIVDYNDDAYDTERPTGYERSVVVFRLDDGREITVDTAFVKILEGHEAVFA